jgi:hypothetical protein
MVENAVEDGEVECSAGTDEGRWLGGEAVMEAQLPRAFGDTMEQFLGGTPVETLGEWVDAIRTLAGGGVDFEQLCHAETATPHRAEWGEESSHFECFYDAVALAHLVDQPVDIRTESPDGVVVEARATSDGIDTFPPDAVVSFGVAAGAEPAGDEPTLREVYGAICPYVRAFPSRAAYESWADDADAETVALPLSAGVPVAAELVA